MIIIPAIDLIDGQCVRLVKGDFDQKTIYDNNPVKMAKKFERQGAKNLHVVDLSGAKAEQSRQTSMICDIAKQTNLFVQTGGGIRTEDQVKFLLDNGISRVVVGSLAVQQPDTVQRWLNKFGADQIVLALDVIINNNKPFLSTSGWQLQSTISLWDLLQKYSNLQHVLCTDISRDGLLQGPNFKLYQQFKAKFPEVHLQASGGVSSVADITKLRKMNIDATIVGKAIYEGRINL